MKGSRRGNMRQIASDTMAELIEEQKIKRRIHRYRSAGRPRDM